MSKICAACGADGAALSCSACKTVRYCDRDCQKGHWKTHKAACQAAVAKAGGASAPAPAASGGKVASGSARPLPADENALIVLTGDGLGEPKLIGVYTVKTTKYVRDEVEAAARESRLPQKPDEEAKKAIKAVNIEEERAKKSFKFENVLNDLQAWHVMRAVQAKTHLSWLTFAEGEALAKERGVPLAWDAEEPAAAAAAAAGSGTAAA